MATEQIPFDDEILSDDEPEWSCPYCADSDGEPREKSWREFVGDAAHGGMVEYVEERCSKCCYRD